MALNLNKQPEKKTDVKEEKVVAEAPATEGAEVTYGTACGDLAFVCPLGNPANPDSTRTKLPDGTVDVKTTSTIVGYKFKLLKDMDIPNCGTNDGFIKDPMNFEKIDWKAHKAGDVVALTPFETAYLLSQPQFNGSCTGGEIPVSCVYLNKAIQGKQGLATVSAAASTPRVSLRAANGSIKSHAIEDVLTYVLEKQENGVNRKIKTIKPGFEKWAPLAKNNVRKATGGSRKAVDPTKVANKNATAFLAYVNSRK